MKTAFDAFGRLRLLAALMASAVIAPAVHAQDAAAPAADTAEASDGADIIVTAQKRSERLQDVPISIQALNAKQLETKGVIQVSQLPFTVPSLRINYAGINVQPSIRGIGSLVAGPGFYSNIPVYVDGYYVPTPSASDFDLISIASVNVLKGPQGTLFGFNATGGAIQLNTRNPEHTPSILAKFSYGSYNHATAAFYGTTGLSDTLAVDLAASYERSDSFITNVVTKDDNAGRYKRWNIRSKVLWEPTDGISFTAAYAHRDDNNPRTVLTNARDGATVGISRPGNTIVTTRGLYAGTSPALAHIKANSYTLTSNFDVGFADLTSYTGYRTDRIRQGLDYDTTPANIYAAQTQIANNTFTQEVNLTSKKGGAFNWVIGGFYMNATEIYHFFTNTATAGNGTGAPFNKLFDTRNNLKSYAVFADATLEATDHLFLTVGGRYSINKPYLDYFLVPANARGSGGVKFKNFSPRAVVRYELSPQSSIYASFSQGYKSGTLPGSAFSLSPVAPEKIDAYEVGYKVSDNALKLNVASYYYDYRNIQITAFGANGASVTRNAAKAKIYGIDGDLSVDVTPDFNIDLTAAYTNAKYKDFPNAIGFSQNLNPASATYGRFVNVQVNANDFPVARTPRFAGSIGATYGFDVAGGRLSLNGSVFHTARFNFDSVKQLPESAYEILNLRATWTDPTNHFDLAVFGTNVTSTKYRTYSQIDSYSARQTWGDPAMFGASVTIRY